MGRTLHVVASCTDSKRIEPAPEHCLRAYERDSRRGQAWGASLRRTRQPRVPATELYSGPHWVACRQLESDAMVRGWSKVSLWVASAGYGLVAASELLASYSATFTARHADSVPSAPESASDERRAWWRMLTHRGTTIADLSADGAVLVVGSAAYLDALQDDLAAALASASDPERLLIVSAGSSSRFPGNTVTATGGMRTELGGAMTSLNARLARRIVRGLGPSQWSVAHGRAVAARVAELAPPVPAVEREPMTDSQIRAFARRQLRLDPATTASRSLRELRNAGRACEQKRFGRLFREEAAAWRPAAE